jgi:predicted Zn-dependent protease
MTGQKDEGTMSRHPHIHRPRNAARRSVVAGLGAFGLAALASPALAQFSIKLGGGKEGGGFNLNLGGLFDGAKNLFAGHDLDEDDEIRIGEKLYPKLIDRSGGAYGNRRVQAAMDRFAEPLIKTSKRSRFNWQITVLNNNKLNAWALPGGKLAVNKGILRYTDDDSELAAVIAHEIGHAELSHGLEQLKSKKFSDSLSDATRVAISSQMDGLASSLITDKVMEKLEEPIHRMVTGGYSRDLERAADLHILDVFAQTGHDPAKAASIYKVLLEVTPKDSEETTSLFATHPDTEERVAAIEARAAEMSRPAGAPAADGFSDMKRSFPTRKKFRRRA